MSDEFILNKGSFLNFSFNWPNGSGGNANLSGYSVTSFDVHEDLVGLLSLSLTTPATGLITGLITWNSKFLLGKNLYFRIKIISPSNVPTTTNKLWVNVK